MNSVIVSVVIPAFNAANTLAEAVLSVLAQSEGELECLVIDDGSRDETRLVAEALSACDSRVRVLGHPNRENRGVAAARNLGIDEAKGQFLAFLDADDAWLPEKLERQLGVMARLDDVGFVFSDVFNCVDPDPKLPMSTQALSQELFRETMDLAFNGDGLSAIGVMNTHLKSYRFIPSPTPLIRKSLFDGGLRFYGPPTLKTQYEDFLMWRILSTRTRFHCDPKPTAIYRVHNASFTVKFSKNRSSLDHLLGLEEVQRIFMENCGSGLDLELVEAIEEINSQRILRQAHRVPRSKLPAYLALAWRHKILAAALRRSVHSGVVQAMSTLYHFKKAIVGNVKGAG